MVQMAPSWWGCRSTVWAFTGVLQGLRHAWAGSHDEAGALAQRLQRQSQAADKRHAGCIARDGARHIDGGQIGQARQVHEVMAAAQHLHAARCGLATCARAPPLRIWPATCTPSAQHRFACMKRGWPRNCSQACQEECAVILNRVQDDISTIEWSSVQRRSDAYQAFDVVEAQRAQRA